MDERPASDGLAVPVVYLETERLILRRFTADDLDDLVALDGDPAVMRYITGGPPTPRDEMRDDYLPSWLAYYDRGDRYGFWAAIERDDRRVPRLVPPPAAPRGPRRRAGARVPPDPVGMGPRLRHRGVARLGRQGVHRARRAAGPRLDDGRQRRVAAGDGEVRDALRADLRHDWPVRIEGDEEGDVEYAIDRAQWEADRAEGG